MDGIKANPAETPPRENFWRELAQQALGSEETPFYLCSITPFEQALKGLGTRLEPLPVPVRHWFSFKTQPVRPLVEWWNQQGFGIEVVSEFELCAALQSGFAAGRILVNGPAKHHWLHRHAISNLCVNFDSVRELDSLGELARELNWTVGVRFLTAQEFDPETPRHPTQFGIDPSDLPLLVRVLKRHGLILSTAHFHLRSNVPNSGIYHKAIQETREWCQGAGLRPRVLDCGGGLPVGSISNQRGLRHDREFNFDAWRNVLSGELRKFEGVEELWLENGRYLSAGSAVLVVRVLDVKERRGLRQLICNGGRTNNALMAGWEEHDLFTIPERHGEGVPTAVCGPTCMAFDRLARRVLPRSIEEGDCLAWMDAGAYQIPFETHFSHGLAAVLWHDGSRVERVRERESFADWWGRWK